MNAVRGVFHNTPSLASVNYTRIAQETARLEADRRNALNNLTVAMHEVSDLEAKLGLTLSWTPRDSKYQETLRYLRKRDFHRAPDRLQGLVVQRLFELSKANMSGTGMVSDALTIFHAYFQTYRVQIAKIDVEGFEDTW